MSDKPSRSDLNRMKKDELVQLAAELHITLPSRANKAQVYQAIVSNIYPLTGHLDQELRDDDEDEDETGQEENIPTDAEQGTHEETALDRDSRYSVERLEFEKIQLEREKMHYALEMKRMDIEFQRLRSTQLFSTQSAPPSIPPFRVVDAARLIPKFDSTDLENYLITFERICKINSWSRDKWSAILQTQLTGKGLKVFSEMSEQDCCDYDKLKQALLISYELCSEVYRKRFRTFRKLPTDTYADFAFKLSNVFKRWLDGNQSYDEVEKLRQAMLLEQFFECLPDEMRLWLTDRKPTTISQAAQFADQFVAIRKTAKSETSDGATKVLANFSRPKSPQHVNTQNATSSQHSSSLTNPFKSKIKCFFCDKPGHVISQCRKKKQKKDAEMQKNEMQKNEMHKNETQVKSVAFISDMAERNHESDCVHNDIVVNEKPSASDLNLINVHPLFAPFCEEGLVVGSDGSLTNIQILRDTGALQSLLKSSSVPAESVVQTGDMRLIKGIGDQILQVPLVKIQLQSKSINGCVWCGLIDNLPDGVDFLLGNDIWSEFVDTARDDMVVTRSGHDTEKSIQEHSKIPVTVDGLKSLFDDDHPDHGESESTSNLADDRSCPTDNKCHVADDRSLPTDNKCHDDGHYGDIDISSITTRDEFIALQQNDISLQHLVQQVVDEPFPVGKSYIYIKDGMIQRHYVTSNHNVEYEQLVVPSTLRNKILFIAHDIPAAGHLGVKKTTQRLIPHFWWPKCNKDIFQYVKSCDVCQRVGKGSKPPVAPLIPLPVMSEPFTRVAIDIVGPLPTTATGNRFILTIIDHATHYPEAIPLQSHTAENVATALAGVFSRFGFAETILSDQGSDFMSQLMQIFLHNFNISQIKTSPYHPQSNSICERFHRTMKGMIKSVVDQFGNEWDTCLPWILFAYREIPVEGLGFSPFELMFGRNIRGPLQVIKDTWSNNNNDLKNAKQNVLRYMLDLREKVAHCQSLALEQAKLARVNAKKWYDKRARQRHFEVGQFVLVLLPVNGKPLDAKYQGPFKILERVGPVDYMIELPGRRKPKRVVHVNMLKLYHERDWKFTNLVTGNMVNKMQTVVDENDELGPSTNMNEPDDFVLDNVLPERRRELSELLQTYDHLFNNKPGRTSMASHHIELKPGAKPVKLFPYRVNPEKADLIAKEIEIMKNLGVIEDSQSPWASPVVILPKPDGSIRFCIDYRKVNDLTVPEPYPMPRIDDLIDRIGSAKYLTKIDMSRGYWQVPFGR